MNKKLFKCIAFMSMLFAFACCSFEDSEPISFIGEGKLPTEKTEMLAGTIKNFYIVGPDGGLVATSDDPDVVMVEIFYNRSNWTLSIRALQPGSAHVKVTGPGSYTGEFDVDVVSGKELAARIDVSFEYDEIGRCFGNTHILASEYLDKVVGNGWQHDWTLIIDQEGNVGDRSAYENIDGAGPSSLYVEDETHLVSFAFLDYVPEMVSLKTEMIFDGETGVLKSKETDDEYNYMQLISVDGNTLYAMKYLGVNSFGNIYSLVCFKKMTPSVLEDYMTKYNYSR